MDDTMTQDQTQTQDTTAQNTQTQDTQTQDTQDTSQGTDTLLSQDSTSDKKTQQTAPDTVVSQPVSPVKPDGTFIENWKDLLPEELREEKSLDSVTDFNNAIKQLVNHKKMVGKDKVVLPNDKSSEDEWNSFYEAIGRPKTHTGYKDPEIPEELSEIFSKDRLERAKERAYTLGATQKQFDEFIKGEMQEVVQTIQQSEQDRLKSIRDQKLSAEKELRAELGAAYDERIHLANKVITEGIKDETKRVEFIEKYGNDPDVIRLLSYVGARTSEHTTMIAQLTQKAPTEVQNRIKEIESNPKFRNINSDMTSTERDQLTTELRQLYQQLHPAKAD